MRLPPLPRHAHLPALVTALALLAALAGPPASAAPTSADRPERTVERARAALAGEGGDPGRALRVLHRALPRLAGADPGAADEARDLLARPTDGVADERGDGYEGPSRRRCSEDACVHWVTTGRDAPPDRAWARTTLRVVQDVLDAQVDELGYRPPLGDGGRGGDERLDVHLADVGARGLFGYCAPEDPPGATTDETGTAAAYCVLDDDFARDQFEQGPVRSLRVTAAHELFHAVQLAYDAEEDGWLQESTATWMEERLADDADDNRRYLPYGQLRRPGVPLDRFDPSGFAHYGAWVFWAHLAERFGDDVVRGTWERAAVDDADAEARGRGFSTAALRHVLRERGARLPLVLGRYVAANLAAPESYEEATAWPTPRVAVRASVPPAAAGRGRPASPVRAEVEVDHLAAAVVALVPRDGAGRRRPGGLSVTVDGPARAVRPVAWLAIDHPGRTTLRRVRVDATGAGSRVVALRPGVERVRVALVNASSAYRCARPDPAYACRGTPVHDDEPFTVTAATVRAPAAATGR